MHINNLQRSRILDCWDAGMDTFDIAMKVFEDRTREADVYNELAKLSGETLPILFTHPSKAKEPKWQGTTRKLQTST